MRIKALTISALCIAWPVASFAQPLYVVIKNMTEMPMQVRASIPYTEEVVTIVNLAPGQSQQVLCGEIPGVTLSVMKTGETSWTLAYPITCVKTPAEADTAKLR